MSLLIFGVELPDIPADVISSYPYVVIAAADQGGLMYASKSEFVFGEGNLVDRTLDFVTSSGQVVLYEFVSGSDDWTYYSTYEGAMRSVDKDDRQFIWSNHNIYVVSSYDKETGEYTKTDSVWVKMSLPKFPNGILDEYPYYCVATATISGERMGILIATKSSAMLLPYSLSLDDNNYDNLITDTIGFMVYMYNPLFCVLTNAYSWYPFTDGHDKYLKIDIYTDYKIIDSNYDIYIVESYGENNVAVVGSELAYVNPHKITTSDRHYISLASRVRDILGCSTKFRPRDLPNAVIECLEKKNTIDSISHGVVYGDSDNVSFRGTNIIYPGACCGSEITNVHVPDGITAIGACSFMVCYDLTDVNLPDSITSIEDRAFYNDYHLKNINLPDSVTSIGDYAFAYCSSIKPSSLPGGLVSIGDDGFDGCGALDAPLPDGISSIGRRCFAGTGYTELIIPASLKTIGLRAFGDNDNLTTVTFLGTPTSLGNYLFANCSNLRTINVPWDKNKFNGGWLWSNDQLNVTVNYNYKQTN